MNLYSITLKDHVININLIFVSAIIKHFQLKTAIKMNTSMLVQYSMKLDASEAEKLPI